MRINHNIAALNAYRNLEINNGNTSKSLEKLSSGLRINRAADDAAGLAISEKMRSQIRGLDMAQRNALDGISVVQTADGALSTTQEILQRMRELSVQAANGSNTDSDRSNIQEEINQLTSEVNRIGNTTEFNTKSLLNGSLSSTTGTLGSAVTLDPNATLSDGLYSVDITKIPGTTTYQRIGTVTDLTGSIPSLNLDVVSTANNSDVGLLAGNYQVVLSSQNAKAVGNTAIASGTDVLNSAAGNEPITIDANSLLANGAGYKVGITKTATTWDVQLYNIDGTTPIGSPISLTASDLSDPTKLTNIQVGNAGDGILLDLDGTKLQAMVALSTSTIDFDITSGTVITAQVEDMGGNSFGNAIALTGTTTNSIVDLGNNIKLTYDGTTPGTTVKTGNITFSVNDITPDIYQMSLKQDTDNDGVFEKTLVNNQPFNLGDNVSLLGLGVKVQTALDTTISDNATFKIENGSIDHSAILQIGANAGQTVSLEINDMRSKALLISSDVSGGGAQTVTLLDGSTQKVWYTTTAEANDGSSANIAESALDVTSSDKAQAAISIYDDAVQRISSERARLGAVQNRLEYTVDNLKTMSENVTSSESRIRDVDMALEMTNFTKNNILNQAAQAMLSQANQLPQGVLQLLK